MCASVLIILEDAVSQTILHTLDGPKNAPVWEEGMLWSWC